MKIIERSRNINGIIEFNDKEFTYHISKDLDKADGYLLRIYEKDADSYSAATHMSRYHILEVEAMDVLKEHFGRMDYLTKHPLNPTTNS